MRGGAKTSKNMNDFLGGFGSSDSVSASLKKFAAPGADTADMGIYDLKDPKVVESKIEGSSETYTIHTKAGITQRAWVLEWKDGKIVGVKDKGFVQ